MIDVVCAIIFFGDKVLVTQRGPEMKMPLKWEFPGGKIEDGENEIDCIKREIKEEINIEIEILQRLEPSLYQYPTFTINLIPFIAKYHSGEILLAEHAGYKLLDLEELDTLGWAEADLPIVAQLFDR